MLWLFARQTVANVPLGCWPQTPRVFCVLQSCLRGWRCWCLGCCNHLLISLQFNLLRLNWFSITFHSYSSSSGSLAAAPKVACLLHYFLRSYFPFPLLASYFNVIVGKWGHLSTEARVSVSSRDGMLQTAAIWKLIVIYKLLFLYTFYTVLRFQNKKLHVS